MSICPIMPIDDALSSDEEKCQDYIKIKKRLSYKDEIANETQTEVTHDKMRVYLRVKPLTDDEITFLQVENSKRLVIHAPKDSHNYKNTRSGISEKTHKFTFSRIFDDGVSQREFFEGTILDTVKDVFDGQNSLIFTYGVTSSGKTYTIQGTPQDGGILPRALDVLFNSVNNRQTAQHKFKPVRFCEVAELAAGELEKMETEKTELLKNVLDDEDASLMVSDQSIVSHATSRCSTMSTMSEDSTMDPAPHPATEHVVPHELRELECVDKMLHDECQRDRHEGKIDVAQEHVQYSIWVSFVEIYNKYIYDLLVPVPKDKKAKREKLDLVGDDKKYGRYIKDLKLINVQNADEAYKILTIGKKNLQVACTKLNQSSSRSHCIFMIKLLRVTNGDCANARVSTLSFCDLAGSERQKKTDSKANRLKEAGAINQSLSALGNCIEVLRQNEMKGTKKDFVPFRNDILTQLLQGYFCGKGRAAMIVNISQLASLFDETLHALKYSAIATEVVVPKQDFFKPPQPKRLKPNPQKAAPFRSSRNVSLALAKGARMVKSGSQRQTIGWATPGTIKEVLDEEDKLEAASQLPLPIKGGGGDDDLEDDLETEEDEDDETDAEENNNKYMETIKNMKVKEKQYLDLIEEMKVAGANALLDAARQKREAVEQVRKEMTDEMNQIVNEINEMHRKDKEKMELLEDYYENRIELLTKSVQNQSSNKRKRARVDDDETDDAVIQKLTQQNKELQERLKERDEKLAKMEDELKAVRAENEGLREDKSTLQFELAELKFNLKDITNTVDSQAKLKKELEKQLEQERKRYKVELATAQKTQESVIKDLRNRNESLQTSLSANEKQLREANEMLSEAGEAFEEKSVEIQKLQDESSRLKEVNKDLERHKKDTPEAIAKLTNELNETKGSYNELETSTKSLQIELNKLKENLVDKEKDNFSLHAEVAQVREQLAHAQDELANIGAELVQVKDAKAPVAEQSFMNESLFTANEARCELEVRVEKYEYELSKYKNELEESEKTVKELSKQLQLLQKVVNDDEKLKTEVKQSRKEIKERDDELRSLRSKLVNSEKHSSETLSEAASQHRLKVDELCDKISKLESDCLVLADAKTESFEARTQIIALHKTEVSTLTDQISHLKSVNSKHKAESEAMTKQVETLQRQLRDRESAHLEFREQNRDAESKQKELQDKIEEYILRVNEQAEENGVLQDSRKADQEKLRTMEVQLGTIKREKDSSDKALSDSRIKNSKLEDAINDLEKCLRLSKESENSAMQQMEEERVQTKKAMEELRELRDNVEDSALRTETEQSERLKQLEAELEKQRDQSRDAIQGEQSARTLASSLRDELKSAQLLATRAEALEKEKKKLEQDCDRYMQTDALLRKQLREAGERAEAQNAVTLDLEAKLQGAQATESSVTQRLQNAEDAVDRLKFDNDISDNSIMWKDDDCKIISMMDNLIQLFENEIIDLADESIEILEDSELRAEKSASTQSVDGALAREKDMRDELQEVRTELRALRTKQLSVERRLETAQEENKELLSKVEVEREKLLLVRKDAKENDRMMEEMKNAMHEQEETMNKQDEVLQSTEKKVIELTAELNERTEQCDLAQRDNHLADKCKVENKQLKSELTKLEKLLSETRLELENKQRENREKSQSRSQESEEKISILLDKFKTMENKCRQLEVDKKSLLSDKEVLEREKRVLVEEKDAMEEDKRKTLTSLRSERDKLLAGLRGQAIEKEREEELLEQLREKDQVIEALQKAEQQVEVKKERSVESEELRQEVEALYRQLAQERQEHQSNVATIEKANKTVISELKLANQTLQSNFAAAAQTQEPLKRSSVEEEPKTPVKKRSRRKRAENDDAPVSENGRKSTRGRGRGRSKAALDEAKTPMEPLLVSESDVLDLSTMVASAPRSTRTSRTRRFTQIEEGASEPSPDAVETAPAATSARKRKLRSQAPQVFDQAPSEVLESPLPPASLNPHETVTRSLRSRKR